MIRLTWLQFRAQAVTAAAALAAFAILLAATGLQLASLYTASGLGSCQHLAESTYTALYLMSVVIIPLAPAVIGLFWGAPLIARELETGTSALAWNQSVTRTRWLAVKLTAGGLTAMAVTEALCLMQAWWAAPIRRRRRRRRRPHPGPVHSAGLRYPRHHPARLRGVRLRPRRRRRGADPAHRPGHGRHPGHLRRRPGRHAAVDPPQLRPGRPHGHLGRHRAHQRNTVAGKPSAT